MIKVCVLYSQNFEIHPPPQKKNSRVGKAPEAPVLYPLC